MNPIQRDSVAHAKSLGYLAHKMSTDNEVGWPDYMFVGFGGLVLFIEFKRPGEPLRAAQKRMITKMATRGFRMYVIDNVDEFKRILSLEKKYPV